MFQSVSYKSVSFLLKFTPIFIIFMGLWKKKLCLVAFPPTGNSNNVWNADIFIWLNYIVLSINDSRWPMWQKHIPRLTIYRLLKIHVILYIIRCYRISMLLKDSRLRNEAMVRVFLDDLSKTETVYCYIDVLDTTIALLASNSLCWANYFQY